MPEIKVEVPEGRNKVEMSLVRMLKKHRSWADVRDISEALWRVGFIADGVEREVKLLKACGCSEDKNNQPPAKQD